MQHLGESIRNAYPDKYVLIPDVADGSDSWLTDMNEQVKQFAELVNKDSRLSGGFHLAGVSQGALIARAYVERFVSLSHRLL
jgi:palmitoyl-protein thioesterase